jgi:hypothetical protein
MRVKTVQINAESYREHFRQNFKTIAVINYVLFNSSSIEGFSIDGCDFDLICCINISKAADRLWLTEKELMAYITGIQEKNYWKIFNTGDHIMVASYSITPVWKVGLSE